MDGLKPWVKKTHIAILVDAVDVCDSGVEVNGVQIEHEIIIVGARHGEL